MSSYPEYLCIVELKSVVANFLVMSSDTSCYLCLQSIQRWEPLKNKEGQKWARVSEIKTPQKCSKWKNSYSHFSLVFGLTCSRLGHTIYHTQWEHAIHYTNDAFTSWSEINDVILLEQIPIYSKIEYLSIHTHLCNKR